MHEPVEHHHVGRRRARLRRVLFDEAAWLADERLRLHLRRRRRRVRGVELLKVRVEQLETSAQVVVAVEEDA